VKSDQTFLLLSASLPTSVVSLTLPLVSVHTYCQNRIIAAVFGVVSMTVFAFFFRGQGASTGRKVASVIGKVLCVLALAINVAFILHATRLCRHMFD
jgi:hypothetical protein